MDEYHDGILLFDLMNEKVWSKAVKDKLGLVEFYNSLVSKEYSEKYFEPERMVIKVYETYDEKNHKKLIKHISKDVSLSDEYLTQKFNKKSNLNLKIYEEVLNKLETNREIVIDSIENYKKDRAKRSQEINIETPKNNKLSKPSLSGDLNSNILEN